MVALLAYLLGVEGNATFGDNDKAIFGAGSDLQIYHDGQWCYSGRWYGTRIRATIDAKYMAKQLKVLLWCCALCHGNAEKIATTSTGVDVTGTVTAEGCWCNGLV